MRDDRLLSTFSGPAHFWFYLQKEVVYDLTLLFSECDVIITDIGKKITPELNNPLNISIYFSIEFTVRRRQIGFHFDASKLHLSPRVWA